MSPEWHGVHGWHSALGSPLANVSGVMDGEDRGQPWRMHHDDGSGSRQSLEAAAAAAAMEVVEPVHFTLFSLVVGRARWGLARVRRTGLHGE